MAQTEGCGTPESESKKDRSIDGVVVRVENGPQILFIDLDGNESICALLKSPKLSECDLYFGEFVIEGQKAPIHKIAKIEKNYYVVNAKYAQHTVNKSVVLSYDSSKKYKICILGIHSKYICHEENGDVVCNRVNPHVWEQFISIPIKDEWIALKSWKNKYLSARKDGAVIAVNHCKAWEYFQVIPNKNGTVSFKSQHNQYLSAQPDGRLECNRKVNNDWEHFKIKIIEEIVDEKENKEVPVGYDPNKKCKISMFGHHNKYICCESNGNVLCDRKWCKEWEHFWSVPMGNGLIGLYTHHNKYLSVEQNGKIIGNRGWCKGWEQFKVIQNKNGTFGLKSYHGKYLSAQSDGRLECNRQHLNAWEQFKITVIQ